MVLTNTKVSALGVRFSLEAGAEFSNWKLLLSRWTARRYRRAEIGGSVTIAASARLVIRLKVAPGVEPLAAATYEGIVGTIVQLFPFKTSVVIRTWHPMQSDFIKENEL